MCNLYTTKASPATVAAYFKAQLPINFNAGEGDVHPGGPGMVVRDNGGERIVDSMVWGWPRPMFSKKTGLPIKPKAVNNIARLNVKPWSFIAGRADRRCIIPLTGFCEAEGEEGRKTRTWFRIKDQPIFAWAGMWDHSDTWGDWYSGLMTNCNEVVRPVHNRMPALIHADEIERWLHEPGTGFAKELIERCFPDELTMCEPTQDPWFRRRAAV